MADPPPQGDEHTGDLATLPHETHDPPEAASSRRRSPLLVWSLWHPTGEAPTRQGGSWTGSLAALRWSRYAWVLCANLAVMAWLANRLWQLPSLPAIAFGLALLAAVSATLDALAVPLARMEREHTTENLAAAVSLRLGRPVDGFPLVALIHDERPEWPPGSFADAFAFLEIRPDALVLHRMGESWTIPREAIECIAAARYMGGRGHPLALGELATPSLRYRADSGALKTLAVEWLQGAGAQDVAHASDVLRRRLESWIMGAEADDVARDA